MRKKKIIIKRRTQFEIIKERMTREDFYDRFELAMSLVSEILAEEGMVKLYFEDSRVATKVELVTLLKKGLINPLR